MPDDAGTPAEELEGASNDPPGSDAYFEKLSALNADVLKMKKVGVLAETMEVNDLGSQYASIIFFVCSIILTFVFLIALQVVGVRYSFPNLFCWWDTYYTPASRRPVCRTQQASGLVPEVTPTMLALAYSYPAVFSLLNTLTIYPDIPPQAAAFLLLCVEQKGRLITPIHWRGTREELGYHKLAGMWLPADMQSVLNTASSLVALWAKCPGAWRNVATAHHLDPNTLPSKQCVEADIVRVFASLGTFARRNNLDLCPAWSNWLISGCPPGGRDNYPFLPWNEVLHPPVAETEGKKPRLTGSYGWPIGWANSLCENPFYAWVPMKQGDEAPDADRFFEVSSLFDWCAVANESTADSTTALESPLGILFSTGLVGLGLSQVGTNTQTSAADFYDYMFSPNTGLMTRTVKTDCDAQANLDGVSAGMGVAVGLSFMPVGGAIRGTVGQAKMVSSWEGSLKSMGYGESGSKMVTRGGQTWAKWRGSRSLASELANTPWKLTEDKSLVQDLGVARREAGMFKNWRTLNRFRDAVYGTDTQLQRAMASLRQAGVATDDAAKISSDLATGARKATEAAETVNKWARRADVLMLVGSAVAGGVVGFLTASAEKDYCKQFNDNLPANRQPFPKCVRTSDTPLWLGCVCMDSPECCAKYGEESYLDKIDANVCEPDRDRQQDAIQAKRTFETTVRRVGDRHRRTYQTRRLDDNECKRICKTHDPSDCTKTVDAGGSCDGSKSCTPPWVATAGQCPGAPDGCYVPPKPKS